MMNTHRTSLSLLGRSQKRLQRGAGLIEVLVAVLILALGLLGMAGLQANALKKNQSSYARAQAVMFSYYILDSLRADRSGAQLGTYNTPSTGICDPDVITGTTLPDNTQRAWIEGMRRNLGDTNATCGIIDCNNAGVCTVTVQWDDSLASGLGAQSFTTRSSL